MTNMFCNESLSEFNFSPATLSYIKEHFADLKCLNPQEEERLLDYLVSKGIEALCQANQFYEFDSFDRSTLRKIYRKLLENIKGLSEDKVEEELRVLAKRHYRALQNWLKRSNPFAKSLYPVVTSYLEQEVVCGEYAAQTQLQILNIDINNVQEPILDLGCGQQTFLVKYLKAAGLKAYGVDRNVTATDNVFQSDWFEFVLEDKSWGTIISNAGFSNHFQHHHLRVNGNYTRYAVRYMEILKSLKAGGAFYYAPDLPFIEQYLDVAKFQVQKKVVAGTAYSATKVVKL